VDRITGMLDTLTELSDDQVAELQSEIISQFETVEKEDPTPQTVDAMTSLADMLDTVRGEVTRRQAATQELTTRAAEAAMRVKGEDAMKKDTPEGEAAPEEAAPGEEKPEEAMAVAPAVDVPVEEEVSPADATEAPVEKTPVDESQENPIEEVTETPFDEEEEKKKEEEAKLMAEASTAAKTASELSIEEPQEVAAPEAVEAVVSAVEAEVVVEEVVAVADEAIAASAEEAQTQENTNAQAAQEDQEAPVTAAVNEPETFEAPADRRPTSMSTAATVAITAGADIPGTTAGSAISDMSGVAEAMAKRLHTLRRVNGGDGEQHIVASLTTKFPEARTLTQDAESNWSKIQAVVGPEALVASGGHQTPFEVKYDIFGIGTTARPVRDALPRFQADRGGIRYITPPVLADYAASVGIWTAANDSAETPSPASKLSLTVTAASETTVATDAVTLQLQFGNLLTRAYPELVARHNELGLIQHAREAEGQLLTRMGALSTAVTSTSLVGLGRDFLVQLGRASAAYRARHRLEADAPLRAIIPAWIRDAMVADLTLAMPGDSSMSAYAEIEGYIASRNVNVTYTLDIAGGTSAFAAQSAGAMNEFPDTFIWYLFAEGSFLFLDGGTLDLGIIRDSTLVGTNDYKMFVETFEGLAFAGVESLKITSTISVNGVAAALRDTTGGASAAAIEY